jgi:hypothetical protein
VACHERPVPSQQCRRLHGEGRPAGLWQHSSQHREQGAVGVIEAWPSDLAAEHGDLVSKHHDLDVFGLDCSETEDDELKAAANGSVEEAKAHGRQLGGRSE